MASVQLVLTGGTPVTFNVPSPTGRVTITIMANPAEVWATTDGSYPSVPTTGVTVTNQKTIAGVLGQQGVLLPSLPGGHMSVAQINLASYGTPTVELEW